MWFSTESLSKLIQCDDSEADGTVSQLAQQAIENITRYSSTICDLQSAVHMLHLTQSLAVYSNQSKSDEAIGKLIFKRRHPSCCADRY